MNRGIVAVAAALLAAGTARADVPVAKGENFEIDAGVVAQALGFGQRVEDPYRADNRMYLFMKEARVRGGGHYEDVKFQLELALGGEAPIAATTGVQLSLLNANVSIPLSFLGKDAYIKVGQFRVPYGREQLTYDSTSQFVDRSINDQAFRVGYDVGAAVTLKPGPFTLIGGVFTGGGRDVPPNHYLPESLGIPQLVGRAGVGNIDDDDYELATNPHPDHTQYGLFVNGMYMKDSNVGHSTVLNVKLTDKSLLLNGNWNPYIGKIGSQGTWWQMGADAAFRTPISARMAVSAEAEGNWAAYSNDYGQLHMAGGRAQVAVSYDKFEAALRYGIVVPDKNTAGGGVAFTGKMPMQEITPSLTWYIHGQNLKLVGDLPYLINQPVFTETNIGSYVGVELPDESTVLAKGGTVGRQNIMEGRLMLQASF